MTGVKIEMHVDDSKITVVTRAQRLSGVALKYLEIAYQQSPSEELSEAILWLTELKGH